LMAHGQRPLGLRPTEQPHVIEHSGVLTTGEQPIDETPDFTNAEPQPDGSLCVIKVKHVQKLEKQQIKECWHQNVTACHETFVTEFKAMQERKCDDNTFWKTCKISFKQISLNYTVKTCFKPLVKKCEGSSDKEICRTWFETQCNTTYVQSQGDEYHNRYDKDVKASTWCEKVPKKICAPDNCNFIPGPEECHDKTIPSTMVKPEEMCDLQPATDCQIVTNLVPHLIRQPICEDVPKEFCHMKLDSPKLVTKPVTMRWCTFPQNYYGPRRAQAGEINLEIINPTSTVEPESGNGNRETRALNQTQTE